MSKGEARTPVVVGAVAPFGEFSPAFEPPQPTNPLAAAGVGNWDGPWGASGAPAGAWPDVLLTSAGADSASPAGLTGDVVGRSVGTGVA
jgi:hypothetical protein